MSVRTALAVGMLVLSGSAAFAQNSAVIRQTGVVNSATSWQYGRVNTSVTNQTGYVNRATAVQVGRDNAASIDQVGIYNRGRAFQVQLP